MRTFLGVVIGVAILALVPAFLYSAVEPLVGPIVSWWFGWGEQSWWDIYWKSCLAIVGIGVWAFIVYHINESSEKQEVPEQEATPKKQAGRKPIPKEVRMYVWQRDQGMCVECGSKERLEYDHIIPLFQGGSNTDRNLQLLCEPCNRRKGASI